MSYMLLKVICVTEGHIKCHSMSFYMSIKSLIVILYVTQCKFICNSMSFYTGLEIKGRKDAKCICFFQIASENCHGNDKKCVCIFQQV